MELFNAIATTGHEQVLFCQSENPHLRAIIAIHDSRLGCAMGATRMLPYATEAAALNDALRLSRGMTYKAACAGIPVGGAKAVIISDPKDKTPELLRAYARFVEQLRGRFVTGQDMNLTPDDVRTMATETSYVVGTAERGGGPGPLTARGVFAGIKAAVRHQYGTDDLLGVRVAVQGLGAVGANVCRRLREEGAILTVTDVRREQRERIAQLYQAKIVAPEDIYAADADVFTPCALGGILNAQTIFALKAKVIAGAANNQLADEIEDGKRIADKGVVYAPDYVINAGGLINVYNERLGYDDEVVLRQIDGIGDTLTDIFNRAESAGLTTTEASRLLAEQRIKKALNRKKAAVPVAA